MTSEKYDRLINVPLEEKIDSHCIITGFVILLISIVFFFLHVDYTFKVIMVTGVRFFSVLYAVNKATSLNRNRFIWGLFALISPTLALIILGLVNFKIDITPIKETVRKYQKTYEIEIAKIDNNRDSANKLRSALYAKHSRELKNEISKKLEELQITPEIEDEESAGRPSSLVITIGGFFVYLFSFGRKRFKEIYSPKNMVTNAKAGYVFNMIILVTMIVFVIYLIKNR